MKRLTTIITILVFSITSYEQTLNVAKLDSLLSSLGKRDLAMGSLTMH